MTIRNRILDIELLSSAYYSQNIAHIVLQAKEDNSSAARKVLAKAISRFIEKPSVIIPIPSRKSNNRRRGYDHAYLLAREVARMSSSRVAPILSVRHKVRDQTALSHEERYENLFGAYEVDSKQILSFRGNENSMSVVLIDDLVTTGASMREGIATLKSAGLRGELRAISACIATHHLPNTISLVQPSKSPRGQKEEKCPF